MSEDPALGILMLHSEASSDKGRQKIARAIFE